MLTCISCSKQRPGCALPLCDSPEGDEDDNAVAVGMDDSAETPSTRQALKALTAQIKDMALKASGAYRHCKPYVGSEAVASRRHHHGGAFTDSEAASRSERFHHAYRHAGSSAASTPRLRRGCSMSSGNATPSVSARTDFLSGDEEGGKDETAAGSCGQDDEKEWVAQVEPGVLISFLFLPQGGNYLKRIRFRGVSTYRYPLCPFVHELMSNICEMFNKWQAQRWWAENYENVMELYNVQKFNHQAVPFRSTTDENSKADNPATPQLNKEPLSHGFQRPLMGNGAIGYSSSDSLEHQPNHHGMGYRQDRYLGHCCYDSIGLASTPKLSSISGAKTETLSIDASVRTSSSPEDVDQSSELSVSVSNASDQEREWVEEDEPGVYITIRALPGGMRTLSRPIQPREIQ